MNRLVSFFGTLLAMTLVLDAIFIEKDGDDFQTRMAKWEDIQESYHSKYLSGMTY